MLNSVKSQRNSRSELPREDSSVFIEMPQFGDVSKDWIVKAAKNRFVITVDIAFQQSTIGKPRSTSRCQLSAEILARIPGDTLLLATQSWAET